MGTDLNTLKKDWTDWTDWKGKTMSRYIDYDAIDYRNDKMHGKSSEFLDGVIYMAQRIEEAPSIEIIRCRECKYFWKYSDLPTKCVFHLSLVNADDFCSYGEKETDHE